MPRIPRAEQALDVAVGYSNNAQAMCLMLGATLKGLCAELGYDTVCKVVSKIWEAGGILSGQDWKERLAGAKDVKTVGNAFAVMLQDWGNKMGREWFIKDIAEDDMTFKCYCFFGLTEGDEKLCDALMDFHRRQIENATDNELEFYVEKGPPVCIFHIRKKKK